MAKVQHFDYGDVLDSLVQEFKWGARTWIRYYSKKDSKDKVIEFDGVAHCAKSSKVWVFYLDTKAVVIIDEQMSEWKEAIALFEQQYELRFEDFDKMEPQQIDRLREENPACLKDGAFLRSLRGLPRIPAAKIWDETDDVIWHKH